MPDGMKGERNWSIKRISLARTSNHDTNDTLSTSSSFDLNCKLA